MQRSFERLRHERFDVLVIGGGITGACLAHDCALRGLSVALVEKGDFACATSSASSKLLHGGIRYLQRVELRKVRESALESAYFQCIAPHLTRWVPFLVPTRRSFGRGRAVLRTGMLIYELLAIGHDRLIDDPSKRPPNSRFLSRDETLQRVPLLADATDLTGAQVLHESHMYNSERMVLTFLKSAVANGAVVANYLPVAAFVQEGSRVAAVSVTDALGGDRFDIKARVVVNAAGPWIPGLNATLPRARLTREVTHFSRGAHIVTRALSGEYALALATSRPAETVVDRGGRHVFVIPWRGHSLIGTSDAPFTGTLDHVRPTGGDVAALLSDINGALPRANLTARDIRYAYAGLYPLTAEAIRPDVYQGTGHYQVVDHSAVAGVEGLVSVLGAKFTTARRVAEMGANVIEQKLRRPRSVCQTMVTPLSGGDIPRLADFTARTLATFSNALDEATIRHLIASYGTQTEAVVAAGVARPSGLHSLAPGRETIEAEVEYAVRHEQALRLEDVVMRRTGLGTLGHPGTACLERCANLMGAQLGWTEERVAREIAQTEQQLQPPV